MTPAAGEMSGDEKSDGQQSRRREQFDWAFNCLLSVCLLFHVESGHNLIRRGESFGFALACIAASAGGIAAAADLRRRCSIQCGHLRGSEKRTAVGGDTVSLLAFQIRDTGCKHTEEMREREIAARRRRRET